MVRGGTRAGCRVLFDRCCVADQCLAGPGAAYRLSYASLVFPPLIVGGTLPPPPDRRTASLFAPGGHEEAPLQRAFHLATERVKFRPTTAGWRPLCGVDDSSATALPHQASCWRTPHPARLRPAGPASSPRRRRSSPAGLCWRGRREGLPCRLAFRHLLGRRGDGGSGASHAAVFSGSRVSGAVMPLLRACEVYTVGPTSWTIVRPARTCIALGLTASRSDCFRPAPR